MAKLIPSDILYWQRVPQEIARLTKVAAGPYQVISDLMEGLPDLPITVWYNPDKEDVVLHYNKSADSTKIASWHIAIKQVPGVETIQHSETVPEAQLPYIHVKRAINTASLFHPVASAAQFEPNALNRLWGGPNPLAATIGGGLLGAGAGYTAGWLGEQVLPEQYFEKGKLRRNMAILGGLAGTTPGLWHGFDLQHRHPDPDQRGWQAWTQPFPWHKPAADNRFEGMREKLAAQIPDTASAINELWEKAADEAGADFSGRIPLDQFGRVIWNDLREQGGFTPAPIAAATTGILQAASLSRGGVALVSPADIARIGVGMGSGYMSGLLVGRTLGAMAGLRPQAQEALQRTGMWAGMLSNVVPMAFGR